jgi:gluconolactonase
MHRRLWMIGVSILVLSLCAATSCAQQRALSEILIDGQEWELVADGFKFLEGPAVDANGVLYFSDLPTAKIYRLNAAGQPEVFVQNGEVTNGLMFGPDGKLYGCQSVKRRIVAYDKKGQFEVVQPDILGNDLVVTHDGSIYVTDPDDKIVINIPPKGVAKIVDRGINRPNGIALWPDQHTLVVSDTLGEYLWAFQIQPDGSLSDKEHFYRMAVPPDKSASGADGIAIDTENRLYVATYLGIQVFDDQGRMIGIISKPQNAFLSNLKFAGAKFNTLYATSTDKLYKRKLNVTGVH